MSMIDVSPPNWNNARCHISGYRFLWGTFTQQEKVSLVFIGLVLLSGESHPLRQSAFMYSLAVYSAKPNFSCGGVPSPRDASSSFSKGVLVLVARSLAGGWVLYSAASGPLSTFRPAGRCMTLMYVRNNPVFLKNADGLSAPLFCRLLSKSLSR